MVQESDYRDCGIGGWEGDRVSTVLDFFSLFVFAVLEVELRASRMQSTCSTTELPCQSCPGFSEFCVARVLFW